MLHFNVSILPVSIQFSNITYQFTVNRNAERFAQVRAVLIIHPLSDGTQGWITEARCITVLIGFNCLKQNH